MPEPLDYSALANPKGDRPVGYTVFAVLLGVVGAFGLFLTLLVFILGKAVMSEGEDLKPLLVVTAVGATLSILAIVGAFFFAED